MRIVVAMVWIAMVLIPIASIALGASAPLMAASAAAPAMAANAYADAAVCGQCHADKARTYRQTGMGRSFYPLTAETAVEDFNSGLPFYHPASETNFNMVARGGKYFQRRWQIGFDGRETNV